MQPNLKYKLGNRVRVTEQGHCFQGAVGTVSEPPPSLKNEQGWTSFNHTIAVDCIGFVTLYWISFDKPQLHESADLPCEAAAVAVDHLTFE